MEPISLTRKIRLYPTTEQANQFVKVTVEYQRLCNLASQYFFEHNVFDDKKQQVVLNKALYYDFRAQSFLGAGFVQSTFKTILARYKTIKTQMAQRPFKYWDATEQHLYVVKRDLSWLRKPVQFRRPQADYVRTKNYSLVENATKISMNGVNGRLKVAYDLRQQAFLLRKDIKLGTAKLVKANGHWFFHVSFTQQIPETELADIQTVVGLDRGLRFITTAYDSQGHTNFTSGKQLSHVRRHYLHLRHQLQTKHTRSAYRRLKAINHRENRYVTEMNHCISKALVDYYGEHTLFVLEDLTNVRETTVKYRHEQRAEHVSWPYYQLEQMLAYKARLNNSLVKQVDAYKTSQRCPKCGRINANNRDHNNHCYRCDRCGFTTNDDRIGAMNIYQLGTLFRSGVKKPSLRHDTKMLDNNGNKTVQIYSERLGS